MSGQVAANTSSHRVLVSRLPAAVLATATLGVLVTAAAVTPRSSGFGTHEELGLPPCGWLMATGSPCPSCGMTTSFSLLAHGEPLEAVRTNPMGVVLAVLAAVVFWGAAHAALTGARMGVWKGWGGGIKTGRLWWTIGGLWALSWAYKVMTWG